MSAELGNNNAQTPGKRWSRADQKAGRFTSRRTSADPSSDLATLGIAAQEQLGLRLESARGPVQVLVIDSISPPTENSASTLAGLGFGSGPNQLLKAGDAVTIKIFPYLSGKPLGYLRSITLANKKEVQTSVRVRAG